MTSDSELILIIKYSTNKLNFSCMLISPMNKLIQNQTPHLANRALSIMVPIPFYLY